MLLGGRERVHREQMDQKQLTGNFGDFSGKQSHISKFLVNLQAATVVLNTIPLRNNHHFSSLFSSLKSCRHNL